MVFFYCFNTWIWDKERKTNANSQREAKTETMKKFTQKLRKNKGILKYLMNMYAEIVAWKD